MVPAHKKRDEQNLKNYCPISLLPVAGKIFERILHNNMYIFFTENNLLSPNQSGFKPGEWNFGILWMEFEQNSE